MLIRKIHWFIFRPKTRGVRALLLNNTNQVLLVFHSYGNKWYLPGGKAKSHETNKQALKREIKEELGIYLSTTLKLLGEYSNDKEYKKDTIFVYISVIQDIPLNNHFEIKKTQFFDINNLPKDISPGSKRRIQEFLQQKSNLHTQW